MSVSINEKELEGATRILTSDDMYQMGLEASVPGADNYDLVTAHKWFNLSAMKGNMQASVYRKELMLEMTAAEVAEAQRVAREWLAANQAILIS